MLIYTSYFAQVKNLPSDIVPISIAAKQVPGWRYPVYKALAPTYNILYDYKRGGDKDHYVAAYLRDVLRYLSPEKVVADLEKLSGGKDIALICYEKSGSFCHRHVVARWLGKAGFVVKEFP
jgi:hypothetical protein